MCVKQHIPPQVEVDIMRVRDRMTKPGGRGGGVPRLPTGVCFYDILHINVMIFLEYICINSFTYEVYETVEPEDNFRCLCNLQEI